MPKLFAVDIALNGRFLADEMLWPLVTPCLFVYLFNCAGETGDIHWQFLNGKLEFSLRGARPTDQWFGYTFEENNWYHIAMTYSVQNKEVRLYLNGELSETKKYDRAVPFLAADAQIGNWPGRAYLGYMKEFRMWKSIRTLEQIKASYKSLLQATDEEKSAGLISLFPLDGHARDLTGGYSGTFKAKYEEASGKAEESIPWNTCLACKSFKCKKGEYRKGTCTKDTVPDGYTCNQCDNLACSSDEFQTGECKGETNQLQCTAQPLCAAGQYFTGGSGTESGKCSACPRGTFRSEDSHREIECAEHVECSVDEHEVQEASPSQNRVCETTKECSANQYESKAPSSDGNRECTGITACTAGQILVTKSTPKTDNVCKDCNGIDEYVGWQSKSECQPMATCGKGQYVTAVGSATSNLACGGCAASTYQGLDSHRLTECTPQPKCDTGQFASNALAKREPLTCEACREGTYMEQTKHRERRCKSYSVRSCGYDEFLENVGSSTRDQLCTLCPDGQVQNKGYHKDTSCEDTTTTTNTTTSTRTRTTKTATTKTSTTATTTTVSTTTITTPIPPTMRDDATGRPDLVQDAVDDFDQVQDDLVAVDKDLVSAESKLADLKKVADDCEDLEVGCDTARSNVAAAQDDVKSLQKQQSDLESAIKDAAVQLGVAASSNTLICGIDRTCGGGNADNSTTVAIVVVALVLVLAIVGAVVYVSRAKAQTSGGYDAPTVRELTPQRTVTCSKHANQNDVLNTRD